MRTPSFEWRREQAKKHGTTITHVSARWVTLNRNPSYLLTRLRSKPCAFLSWMCEVFEARVRFEGHIIEMIMTASHHYRVIITNTVATTAHYKLVQHQLVST